MTLSLRLAALLAALFVSAAHAVEYHAVLPERSTLAFEFGQMGVPVKGGFKRFATELRFDPARPEAGRARIEIDLGSIDAGSPEADEEAAGKLWFNSAVFPKATFVSSGVRALGGNRYALHGTLTLKGRRRPLIVPVTYTPGREGATFDGAFVLKRLDFGIGEGMWADVSAVANEVRVRFRIAARGN